MLWWMYTAKWEWQTKQCQSGLFSPLLCLEAICSHKHPNVAMLLKQYGDENKALTAALQELKMVYGSVCKIHKFPLALAWMSCSSCNDLLWSQLQFKCVDGFEKEDYLSDFIIVSERFHMRKGQVSGRALSCLNMLYCSDVKQFGVAEYPLVPYALQCGLSGWFTICLQSSCTWNEFYVLEFFLPLSSNDNENIMTKISLILGTMEETLITFQLASGQELGEVLSVEIMDFQNDQKSLSAQIQATRSITSLELLKGRGVMLQACS